MTAPTRRDEITLLAQRTAGSSSLADNGDVEQSYLQPIIKLESAATPAQEALVAKLNSMPDPRILAATRQLWSTADGRRPAPGTVVEASAAVATPVCTRAWNAEMLREPRGFERPCAMKDKCAARRKYNMTLREFLTPEEVGAFKANGRRGGGATDRQCLLCIRETLTTIWTESSLEESPMALGAYPQPFKNIVGVPGEYDVSECIPLVNSFLQPVVMFIPSYLERRERTIEGKSVAYLEETRYKKIF